MNKNLTLVLTLFLILFSIYLMSSNSGILTASDLGIRNEFELSDGAMYFINENDHSTIYALAENGEINKISNDSAFSLDVTEDSVYYINLQDRHVYQLNRVTNARKKIIDSPVVKMIVKEDFIYYISAHQNHLYQSKRDGSEQKLIIEEACRDFAIEKNTINTLFQKKNDFSGYYFSRSDMDGKNSIALLSEAVHAIDYDKNWLYYSDPVLKKIFKVTFDGTKK